MAYHYNDIESSWLFSGNGVIGYDIPILLLDEYGDEEERLTLITMALNIGFNIGMAEAEKRHKESADKNG